MSNVLKIVLLFGVGMVTFYLWLTLVGDSFLSVMIYLAIFLMATGMVRIDFKRQAQQAEVPEDTGAKLRPRRKAQGARKRKGNAGG